MADAEKKPEEKKPAEGEAAPAAAPAKGGSKMGLIIGGVVALVLLIGAPVVFFVMKGHGNQTELSADAAKEDDHAKLSEEGSTDEDEIEEGEEPIGAIFPLDTFVVNLAGGKYVRCQVQLEFVERDIPKRFHMRIVPLRDTMITMLASRSAEDLGTQKGREQLKSDIKDVANELLHKEEVKHVYFTQFVIQ